MAKFNKGDVVVVVVEDEDVAKGTVLTIESGPGGLLSGGNYYFKETDEIVLGDSLELISQKPTKKQRIKALEAEVAELKAKVEAYEKAQATSIVAATLLVGDTIRIIDAEGITCNENCQYWGNGDIVKIVGEDGIDWHVSYKGGGSRHFYIRKEAEKHCVEKVVSE